MGRAVLVRLFSTNIPVSLLRRESIGSFGKSSLLHAEVMALALAEQTLGSYELASHGSFELVTSVEPCCQCLGVLMWSGWLRLFVAHDRRTHRQSASMKALVR